MGIGIIDTMSNADTQQTDKRDDKGRFDKGSKPTNGFDKNPQNRNPGGWKPENTISYQYRRMLNMTPDELKAFRDIPTKDRTVAMDIAYAQVIQSQKSLLHAKEVTDRTEGKAQQFVDMTTGGEPMKALVQFMDGNADDKDTTS